MFLRNVRVTSTRQLHGRYEELTDHVHDVHIVDVDGACILACVESPWILPGRQHAHHVSFLHNYRHPTSLFLVPLLHGLSLRSRPRILYMILTATIRIQSISDSWTDGQIGNTTYEISKIERHRFMNCSSWRSCTVKPPLAVTERYPNKSDGYVTKRAVSSLICGGRAAQYNVGLSGRFR